MFLSQYFFFNVGKWQNDTPTMRGQFLFLFVIFQCCCRRKPTPKNQQHVWNCFYTPLGKCDKIWCIPSCLLVQPCTTLYRADEGWQYWLNVEQGLGAILIKATHAELNRALEFLCHAALCMSLSVGACSWISQENVEQWYQSQLCPRKPGSYTKQEWLKGFNQLMQSDWIN